MCQPSAAPAGSAAASAPAEVAGGCLSLRVVWLHGCPRERKAESTRRRQGLLIGREEPQQL
eukprot:2635966-Prymnesium_polylepis.1